jgi:hypothetical protein
MKDHEVAERTGRTEAAVSDRRYALGVPAFIKRKPRGRAVKWTPAKDRLLGTMSDSLVAARLGCSTMTVFFLPKKAAQDSGLSHLRMNLNAPFQATQPMWNTIISNQRHHVAPKGTIMPKAKVNKSDLVRDMLKADPNQSVNDIVKAMADKGHKITANLVYYLKGKAKGAKRRRKRIVRAAKSAASRNGTASKTDAIALIRDVKALATRAGGYERLKELVDALAE